MAAREEPPWVEIWMLKLIVPVLHGAGCEGAERGESAGYVA